MWPAYLKGLEENFPKSQLIFDRYHLIAKANGALDKVRSKLFQTKYRQSKNL